MKKTPAPMTLDAMKAYARQQHAMYADLIDILDRVGLDPLALVAEAERRSGRRGRKPGRPAPPPARRSRTTASTASRSGRSRTSTSTTRKPAKTRNARPGRDYAREAIAALGVATTADVVKHAKASGWRTLAKTPSIVMHVELKKLFEAGELRRVKGPKGSVRWGRATPSKAAAKKLAAAEKLAAATEAAHGANGVPVVSEATH